MNSLPTTKSHTYCKVCDLNVLTKNMKRHLTSTRHLRGNKSVLYKCDTCSYGTPDKTKMVNHLKSNKCMKRFNERFKSLERLQFELKDYYKQREERHDEYKYFERGEDPFWTRVKGWIPSKEKCEEKKKRCVMRINVINNKIRACKEDIRNYKSHDDIRKEILEM